MQESRARKRVSSKFIARCRVQDRSEYHEVKITDLHCEGCCLKSIVGFKLGQQVRIMTDIPGEGPLYLMGRVVWSLLSKKEGGYRVGIKFLTDNPAAIEGCLKLYNYYSER